jgi:hypothetical protein
MNETEFRNAIKAGKEGLVNHLHKYKGEGSFGIKLNESLSLDIVNFDQWGWIYGAKQPKNKRIDIVYFHIQKRTENGYFSDGRGVKEYQISPILYELEKQVDQILKDAYIELADKYITD